MNPKLIPAALFAAMIATPAIACTDWKAVAAFDAVIASNDGRLIKEENEYRASPSSCHDLVARGARGALTEKEDSDLATRCFKFARAAAQHVQDVIDDRAPRSPTSARRNPNDPQPRNLRQRPCGLA
jgi:hypothetical protein